MNAAARLRRAVSIPGEPGLQAAVEESKRGRSDGEFHAIFDAYRLDPFAVQERASAGLQVAEKDFPPILLDGTMFSRDTAGLDLYVTTFIPTDDQFVRIPESEGLDHVA